MDGTVTRTYVADDTGRIVRFCDPDCTGANPVYLVAWNAHGDAVSIGLLDPATGGVTPANRFSYATWGTPTTTAVNGHPDLGFRYLWVGAAGVAWDNSAGQALYDMHARTYSPVLGRFLQPDPARADGNLYAYAGNDPVTKSDPSGQFAIALVYIGWGVVLLFAAAATYHPTASPGPRGLRSSAPALRFPCFWDCGRSTSNAPSGLRCFAAKGASICLSAATRRVPRNQWLPEWAENLLPTGAHGVKRGLGANSRQDIYVDGDGNLILKPKNEPNAEGEDTGIDVEDIPGAE